MMRMKLERTLFKTLNRSGIILHGNRVEGEGKTLRKLSKNKEKENVKHLELNLEKKLFVFV